MLTIAEPRRYRNKEHLRFVAQQACLVCGRKPSDPHHLRFMQPRALGWKVSDEFVAPLCRIHHRAVHRVSDERAWWKQAGIDPVKVARKLWRNSRRNESSLGPALEPNPQQRMRHSKSDDGVRQGTGVTTADMLTDLAASAELFHTADGTAFADLIDRWTPGNLARSQYPASFLVAAEILRSHRCRRRRWSDQLGTRSA